MKQKLSFLQILVLLTGMLLGSLAAKLFVKIPALSWLACGQNLGLSTVTLDLGVLTLTFGFTVSVTIAAILGLIIAILLCRYMR